MCLKLRSAHEDAEIHGNSGQGNGGMGCEYPILLCCLVLMPNCFMKIILS